MELLQSEVAMTWWWNVKSGQTAMQIAVILNILHYMSRNPHITRQFWYVI